MNTEFHLPGYSASLNPDEWVWKNVKHDTVGKTAVHDRGQMTDVTTSEVPHLNEFPQIVCGCFYDPELAYIPNA